MDKRNIKGISKKYAHFTGFILAGVLMGLSPQRVLANDYNVIYEQESNNETDFKKYFNSDIPINNQSQITTESEIYKILEFYEGGAAAENSEFKIELDPAGNLVVTNGLTVKFQEPITNYLTETYGEDIDKIKEKVKSGEKFVVPSNIIEKCLIDEIQKCRDSVINSAKNLNINLGESQINVLTELNYRYGKEQSEDFLKFVLEGKNIEDYSVRTLRSMSEEQWKNSNIQIYTEVVSNEDGVVTYYAYEKPFGALKDFDGSIDELAKIDIEKEVEKTEMQFNGDKRRALFRQIGIMYDVSPIIINDQGTCRYTINGITYESPLSDYLSNYEQQNIEQPNTEQSNIEQPNIDEQKLENTLVTVIDEIKPNLDETEANEILEIFQDDSSTEIEQNEKIKQYEENEQVEQKETALIPIEKKKKINIFKILATLGGMALTALGIKKAKDTITKGKEKNKFEEEPTLKVRDKRKKWLKNIEINAEENVDKLYEVKRRLKVLFEVVDRREDELPKFFKFSDATKRELYREVKNEIIKYKTKSVHTREEKQRYREVRDYEIILQNEKFIKNISKIKKMPRKLILKQLEKDVYSYKKEIEKNNIEKKEKTTEIKENVI